ncbi:hypothetical protein BANRA_03574 [Klebsiella pneumoniae]|nr:hypothetical protein BANRA_03574 [Klebsiella pneumoniae]
MIQQKPHASYIKTLKNWMSFYISYKLTFLKIFVFNFPMYSSYKNNNIIINEWML